MTFLHTQKDQIALCPKNFQIVCLTCLLEDQSFDIVLIRSQPKTLDLHHLSMLYTLHNYLYNLHKI